MTSGTGAGRGGERLQVVAVDRIDPVLHPAGLESRAFARPSPREFARPSPREFARPSPRDEFGGTDIRAAVASGQQHRGEHHRQPPAPRGTARTSRPVR